jgi:hypothetical protein
MELEFVRIRRFIQENVYAMFLSDNVLKRSSNYSDTFFRVRSPRRNSLSIFVACTDFDCDDWGLGVTSQSFAEHGHAIEDVVCYNQRDGKGL